MAYIVNSPGNRFSPRAISHRAMAATFLASIGLCLIALFETGHPFLALWVGLSVFGWLFVAGAASASDTARD
jgi:hypothetical protein